MKDEVCSFEWKRYFGPHLKRSARNGWGEVSRDRLSGNQVHTFKINALLLLRTTRQQEAQLTQKEELEGDVLETILL